MHIFLEEKVTIHEPSSWKSFSWSYDSSQLGLNSSLIAGKIGYFIIRHMTQPLGWLSALKATYIRHLFINFSRSRYCWSGCIAYSAKMKKTLRNTSRRTELVCNEIYFMDFCGSFIVCTLCALSYISLESLCNQFQYIIAKNWSFKSISLFFFFKDLEFPFTRWIHTKKSWAFLENYKLQIAIIKKFGTW